MLEATNCTLDQQVKVRPQSPLRLQRTRAYSSKTEHASRVDVPGSAQEKDRPLAPEDHVDIDDAEVALGHDGT